MLLWGPPGTGKTTLARLLADRAGAEWISISAVLSGVKEIRAAIEQARQTLTHGRTTVLFVDEVHRFNKAQQDAFLPHVEAGTVVFIGATTENPSFEVIGALLSRVRVYVLKRLEESDLDRVLERALHDRERGLEIDGVTIADDARALLLASADGDARRMLNVLEIAAQLIGADKRISASSVADVIGARQRRFDKRGDVFYEQISALHKAVRGSAPDAALYWLCRMLDGGCDPVYIARRVVRMASEDIGNADPRGLQIALAAWDAYLRLGSPEGELALAQAVLYLACVPKSNATYDGVRGRARRRRVRTFVRRAAAFSQCADAADEGTGLRRQLPLRTRRSGRVRGRRNLFSRRDAAGDLLPPGAAGSRAAHCRAPRAAAVCNAFVGQISMMGNRDAAAWIR